MRAIIGKVYVQKNKRDIWDSKFPYMCIDHEEGGKLICEFSNGVNSYVNDLYFHEFVKYYKPGGELADLLVKQKYFKDDGIDITERLMK